MFFGLHVLRFLQDSPNLENDSGNEGGITDRLWETEDILNLLGKRVAKK